MIIKRFEYKEEDEGKRFIAIGFDEKEGLKYIRHPHLNLSDRGHLHVLSRLITEVRHLERKCGIRYSAKKGVWDLIDNSEPLRGNKD